MNFASNRKCKHCPEPRPKRLLNPGEWECPKWVFLYGPLPLSFHWKKVHWQYFFAYKSFAVDVISWILEETQFAWSAILKDLKNKQLLTKMRTHGYGPTDLFFFVTCTGNSFCLVLRFENDGWCLMFAERQNRNAASFFLIFLMRKPPFPSLSNLIFLTFLFVIFFFNQLSFWNIDLSNFVCIGVKS